MRFRLALLSALALSLSSLLSYPMSTSTALAASNCAPATPFCYFHGTQQDQANKATIPGGTATFNDTAPSGTLFVTQTTSPFANEDFVGNPLAAFWQGPFSGAVSGNLELKWWWSTTNATATALGAEVQVSVFADPDFNAPNPVQPEKLIGRAFVVLAAGINAVPQEFTNAVPVSGTVTSTLLIQVVPRFVDTGENLLAHYDATSTPSRFHFVVPPPPPTVVFDTTPVAFAPATVVSAHFLGAEPQTTLERRLPGRSQAGRLDPNRIFVDWPLTSRTQTSQLSRSTDGSDSFRLLFDRTCASRNRPNCLSGGGGDSEDDVNLINGNVFFLDQEGLVVNEGLGSSVDHGDTFPATRDHAVTNTAAGVDRQWLAWVDPFQLTPATSVEAFMAYHVPAAGQFIQAIDQNGLPLPQSVPQILLVLQSGQLRVDNSGGPAHRWIYQPYRGGGGVTVSTAYAPNYAIPAAWQSTVVSTDSASIFPWLNIDSSGNAYLVWVAGGQVFLSVSPINDAKNKPPAGRPGTYWTTKANVTLPAVQSAVFPEVTAGDFGRIAITYMGSEDCAPGRSDDCAATSHWNTYVGIIPDALALARGTPMTVSTGKVNHRTVHRGSVCTGGTTCTGDRSLLDMTDLGFDEAGRVGVVFMDNNNRLAAPTLTDTTKNGPFAEFSKEVLGPSLLATTPDVRLTVPQNARTDPAGDATWPNIAAAVNLPSLDLLGASISINPADELVVRVPLADATRDGMVRDLKAYNKVQTTQPAAARLQYVAWFAAEDDVFHMSMEVNADGTIRFFGGRLDGNDTVQNGTGAIIGARYRTDPSYPVTGSLAHGTLTLRAPRSLFGLGVGSKLYSVTVFATAAPAEADPTAGVVVNSARTVDATPPFDATLQLQPEPSVIVDCTDPNITTFGGWHTLSDSRAGNGTLCRTVGQPKDKATDFMQLQFRGTSIDVIAAKGPRGGNFNVTVDGGPPTKVDLFRPATDPAHPDNSGRKDLTFGVNVFHRDTGPGTHTLRIDVLNDNPDPNRDMVYIDEFRITGGDVVTPTSVGTADVATTVTGTLTAGTAKVLTLAIDTATRHVALVLETASGVTLTLRDATDTVIETARDVSGITVIDAGPISVGLAAAILQADTDEAFEMWEVLTENR